MNLDKIKETVNSSKENAVKELEIIIILSQDENVIPTVLKILNKERTINDQLITETNAELSRALVTLVEPHIKLTTGSFVIGQIKAHYHKWKDKIKCNFRFDDLP